MNIYCDDGSTNVKLAWFEGNELQTRVSANSFRHGWKVAEFSAATVISTCWPCIMRC